MPRSKSTDIHADGLAGNNAPTTSSGSLLETNRVTLADGAAHRRGSRSTKANVQSAGGSPHQVRSQSNNPATSWVESCGSTMAFAGMRSPCRRRRRDRFTPNRASRHAGAVHSNRLRAAAADLPARPRHPRRTERTRRLKQNLTQNSGSAGPNLLGGNVATHRSQGPFFAGLDFWAVSQSVAPVVS